MSKVVTKLVTTLKVSPSDWLTNPDSVNLSWQIWYRYKGKLVKLMGMNREKDYSSRVRLTLEIIKQEEQKLTRFGYNPISKTYLIAPPRTQDNLNQTGGLTLVEALDLAYAQLKVEHCTLLNVKSCIKYLSISAGQINISRLRITEVGRKHLKLLMNECEVSRKLSSRNFNVYRSYLIMLFQELEELELVEHNPARELKKRRETLSFREVLSDDERKVVKNHLSQNHPSFYNYVQIFFHSGSRCSELLSLKIKDVNLDKGEFRILIKKGRQKRTVVKVIKEIAKQFWLMQIRGANPDDYVFSEGLMPGPNRIRKEHITRRWKTHVKDKLKIKADLYSLKHLNTEETAAILSIKEAALQNGHMSTEITKKHYAYGEAERQRQKIKSLRNEF